MRQDNDRRGFLKTAMGLAAGGVTLGGCARDGWLWSNGGLPSSVIDTHTHFYDPTRPEGVPWPPEDDPLHRRVMPEEYTGLVEPLGVTGTVVVEASPWVEDNAWLLELARRKPAIVAVVGNLDPADAQFADHLERFAADPLFRGIRINAANLRQRLEDEEFVAGIERLAAADLSLDLLGGSTMLPDALTLSQVAPELRIVLDHLPFDRPEDSQQREAFDRALDAIAERPTVYAKISNVLREQDGELVTDVDHYRPRLDELWARFGERRVIYGSNWPVSNRVGPYEDVLRVVAEYVTQRGPEPAARFFAGNAADAYKFPRPRASV